MIDLRSDTVPPSPEVRRAMAEAATGDELYGEDPTTRRLEEKAAEVLGKEAALFAPTGTMANALAVLVHGCEPDRVLMDVHSHIYRREMQPASVLSGLRPTLFDAWDGCPDIEDIARLSDKSPLKWLICQETAHTWRQGQAADLGRLARVRHEARHLGAVVHLDGARLFHAAWALHTSPHELAAVADSVVVSLCKGTCAPAGALLGGTRSFIAAARGLRTVLGGTLRQSGMLAAAALLALDEDLSHFDAEFAWARRIAEALAVFEPLQICPSGFSTNAVMFNVDVLGVTGAEFVQHATEEGVHVALLAPNRVRLLTHRNLTDARTDRVISTLSRIIEAQLHAATL